MPKVSVVMNCYNGARYLREAIESIYAQTYQDWEIIFWDNASTDGSDAIAKSFGERLRYFRSETTTTLGEARNNAFAKASGDYIAILDTDDLWLPKKLEKQIPLLEKDNAVGLVFCDSIIFNNDGDQYTLFQYKKPYKGYVFGELLQNNFMFTVSMLYRRIFLNNISPLFSHDFRLIVDYDLSLRIAYKYKLNFVNETLTKLRIHAESECNRNRFLVPKEFQKMLMLFSEQLQNFPEAYKHAYKSTIENIDLHLALESWSKGEITSARKYFKHHATSNGKHLCGLLGTYFFPFKLDMTHIEKTISFLKKTHRLLGAL